MLSGEALPIVTVTADARWQRLLSSEAIPLTPGEGADHGLSRGRKRVLPVEDWAEIRRLHRAEGLPIKAIVRLLGVSRNTVRAAIASDGDRKSVV